ncbi:EVE domain-containing protein [Parvibium lacunae]|uniref:UPF0310 protein DU000_01605 n=1 Tax=Parvibium lacunae TaxID=1888893 RepID=A0A368L7B0_9BURK|nr:EVE domain-containing protein [Parvibium lacunae]RCS59452.1 EVE domain-containing protein [Parvibium lacunae]
MTILSRSASHSAPRYWIGVVSDSHVQRGVTGGFCQLCHGKAAPLKRMQQGDWLIYYSPKYDMNRTEPYQAFTALGRVADNAIYQFAMTPDFIPWRRQIDYLSVTPAPIRPLLDQLDFIQDKQHWGAVFRHGYVEINQRDFLLISQALGVSCCLFLADPA